jgi:UDP-glucose 4,6-dehydratase
MILLLGKTGYIGQAFEQALKERGTPFTAISRSAVDYTNGATLRKYLEKNRPDFIVNAAGYTGKPNVDACESNKADALQGNTLFPLSVANVCDALDIPWGHVSSGCIFAGCWVKRNGVWEQEKNMTSPEIREFAANSPANLRGFDETVVPNFSFRDAPCSFYSGTKALGEEAIAGIGNHYVWRLRIPFDQYDNHRNFLSKIQRYEKVYDNFNSLSHRADYVNACLDTWFQKAPFGIYNVTNPGFISTAQVVEKVKEILKPNKKFTFWENDLEFYKEGAIAARSNCIMDSSKLINAGVRMRGVEEALDSALRKWISERI